MKIGCHISIAGGITNAPKRATDLGCEVFQCFTRSPQGGSAPELTPELVQEFKKEMKKSGQKNFYIHTPYYINFASANEKTRKASARIVREELERGSLLGAKYVMTHLGSAKDVEEREAVKMTAEGVAKVMDGYEGATELLLEISAGAGQVIGDTFEELAEILKIFKQYDIMIYHTVGICLDSAHMFASGYDIKTEDGMRNTMEIIRNTIEIGRVKLIHANDSKVGLGEKKDRHDHIGDGKIGVEGFENLIKTFPEIDLILETKHDKVAEDIIILKEVRKKIYE